jgi:hypothetical protein
MDLDALFEDEPVPEPFDAPEPVPEPAPEPEPLPPAPAGEPDYHLLAITPEFNAEWFFTVGMRYWQTFRPTVMAGWELAQNIRADERVALTVLVSSDEATAVEADIRAALPGATLDVIEANSLNDLRAELDWRVRTGKRLG